MLAQRNIRIINRLLQKKNFISVKNLADELNMSPRAIRYDLDQIDYFFKENGFPLIDKIPKKGIRLLLKDEDLIKLQSILESKEVCTYDLSKNERIHRIMNSLIDSKKSSNLQELSQQLGVSISTINKDILTIKEDLETFGIQLEYHVKTGYSLLGEEEEIRNYFSKFYKNLLIDEPKDSLNYLDLQSLEYIQYMIEFIEQEENLQLTDESLNYLKARLYVVKLRIENGYKLLSFQSKMKIMIQNSNIFCTFKYYQKKIEKQYTRLNEFEILYISQHFLGANFISYVSEEDQEVYIRFLVANFVSEVSKEYGEDFNDETDLIKNLYKHFKPMINRIIFNIPIENPLLMKVKMQYANLFESVSIASHVIENFCGNKVSEEEIAYLCMHFGLVINKHSKKRIQRKKIVIVCPSGLATSLMISTALETNYYVDVVSILSLREFKKNINSIVYDYIVSTVDLSIMNVKKFIQVNPILSFENICELNTLFLERIHMNEITYEEVFKVIKDNCIVKNEEQLKRQLCNLLNLNENIKSRKGEKMLKDVVNENLIECNVDIKDWKEAIQYGGNLLLKEGIIEPTYIDAMIETKLKLGPYIVLEEGIALPHAMPQNDTHAVGVSIITLKNPIEFGHEENDPVHLVICLASIDGTSHMRVLADIAKIFDGDEDYYHQILQAKSKEEVMKIVNKISEE